VQGASGAGLALATGFGIDINKGVFAKTTTLPLAWCLKKGDIKKTIRPF
jgi:hypothetical protein